VPKEILPHEVYAPLYLHKVRDVFLGHPVYTVYIYTYIVLNWGPMAPQGGAMRPSPGATSNPGIVSMFAAAFMLLCPRPNQI